MLQRNFAADLPLPGTFEPPTEAKAFASAIVTLSKSFEGMISDREMLFQAMSIKVMRQYKRE